MIFLFLYLASFNAFASYEDVEKIQKCFDQAQIKFDNKKKDHKLIFDPGVLEKSQKQSQMDLTKENEDCKKKLKSVISNAKTNEDLMNSEFIARQHFSLEEMTTLYQNFLRVEKENFKKNSLSKNQNIKFSPQVCNNPNFILVAQDLASFSVSSKQNQSLNKLLKLCLPVDTATLSNLINPDMKEEAKNNLCLFFKNKSMSQAHYESICGNKKN